MPFAAFYRWNSPFAWPHFAAGTFHSDCQLQHLGLLIFCMMFLHMFATLGAGIFHLAFYWLAVVRYWLLVVVCWWWVLVCFAAVVVVIVVSCWCCFCCCCCCCGCCWWCGWRNTPTTDVVVFVWMRPCFWWTQRQLWLCFSCCSCCFCCLSCLLFSLFLLYLLL